MNLTDRLADYESALRDIHEHFGYREDWAVIPLACETDQYWFLTDPAGKSGLVVYSPERFTAETIRAGRVIYDAAIYTQRHLPKWVYRAGGHALVCADTRTDGNKFLMVFDEAKECKDQRLIELYRACW